MPRKKSLSEKPEPGIEWSAISDYLRKLEITHSGTFLFTLSTASGGYRSFVDVEVVATLPTLIGPARPLRLSLFSHFPHPKHSSLQSLLLELLKRIDARISEEVYKQRELPLILPPQ